jgi:ribosome-associated heat shock protein Hsp15
MQASPAPPLTSLRVDKWLHHVRIYKTRTLATQACERGHVKEEHREVKASRILKGGEVLHVERGDLRLVLKVLAFPEKRVGAPTAVTCYENLTPVENYQRASEARQERALVTPKPHEQLTRPTKKDLRAIRQWLGREDG